MDVDGNLTLDEEELKSGLQQIGMYLNNREMEEVFWEFDRDKSGAVSYDEFMDGVRGVLTDFRALLVEEAWAHLGGGPDVSFRSRIWSGLSTASGERAPISLDDEPDDRSPISDPFPLFLPKTGILRCLCTIYQVGPRASTLRKLELAFSERFRLADIEDVALEDFMQFHHDFSAAISSDRLFEASCATPGNYIIRIFYSWFFLSCISPEF